MTMQFPSTNLVFLIGRLTKWMVEAQSGFIDLTLVTSGGDEHLVRVTDRDLAAEIEQSVQQHIIMSLCGSLAGKASNCDVIVAGERGQYIHAVDYAGAPSAPPVKAPQPDHQEKGPLKDQATTASAPIRRLGGRSLGFGTRPASPVQVPSVAAPAEAPAQAARAPAGGVGGFLSAKSRAPSREQEPDPVQDAPGYPEDQGSTIQKPVFVSHSRKHVDQFVPISRDDDIPF